MKPNAHKTKTKNENPKHKLLQSWKNLTTLHPRPNADPPNHPTQHMTQHPNTQTTTQIWRGEWRGRFQKQSPTFIVFSFRFQVWSSAANTKLTTFNDDPKFGSFSFFELVN